MAIITGDPAAGAQAPGNGSWIDAGVGNVNSGIALQIQLKMLAVEQKATQKQLTQVQAKLKALQGKKKPSAKETQLIGLYTKQLKDLQYKVQNYGQRRTDVQNKYYENTGQYDKLLTGENRDAFMALNTLFQQYGLGSLAGKIYDYVKNGYGSDTISILLQDTPEYKKRFAANQARTQAGMSVLSPAEYISVENSYRQIMRQSGLPEGFYDSNDDFTNWIGNDMSPTELQSRVDLATQATALANPAYKQALQQMGLAQGDITAYFLDPDRALPIIQKSAATAAIGAEALTRGLGFDKQYAEELATSGISRDQASQGYAKIADEYSDLQTLAKVYGGAWTQHMAEEDVFKGGTKASDQRDRLINNEKASFSGAAGSARGGLASTGGAR